MRRQGGLLTAALLVMAGFGVGLAVAHAADSDATPWGAQATAPVVLLGRLHHAAARQVQLGELAEAGAAYPQSRRYGAELAADFRAVDQRVIMLARGLGIGEQQLTGELAGENVLALNRESADFSRLANERGTPFDREFWVTVANAQSADSDMLTATVTREPALIDVVRDMSRLYDRSSKKALDAAMSTVAPEKSGDAREDQAPSR
ncbi:MAG TPA: DUF4142 domain-containing protein [Polyangia bacterium]|nr:DUF4142 domain-containing protein [Polyangia bacterium]